MHRLINFFLLNNYFLIIIIKILEIFMEKFLKKNLITKANLLCKAS